MLANSEFYSGAFAPEYGNAFSGVFNHIFDYMNKTSTHDEETIRGMVKFMLHDFGFRGVSITLAPTIAPVFMMISCNSNCLLIF